MLSYVVCANMRFTMVSPSAQGKQLHRDVCTCTNNSLHLARRCARIFVRRHYLFQEANSFRTVELKENCELPGTDNVQGQKSEHIFKSNGGYCVNHPSNIFRNARIGEYRSDIPRF